MKRLLFGCLLFLSFYNTHAQTPDSTFAEPDLYQSNAEKFSDSAGLLIQRDYVSMGHVLGCYIYIVRFTDLNSGTKLSALRFTVNNRSTFLDADEVAALIRSMQVVKEKVLGAVPETLVRISYKSRSGFVAGCFTEIPQNEFNKKLKWTVYLQTRRHDNNTIVNINPQKKDFDILLQILDNAKAKL